MTKYGVAYPSTTTEETSSSSQPAANSGNGGGGSDHIQFPNLPITSHKLNGHNYLQWSQSVMMFVSGKGRDDYLTGKATVPGETDPNYRKWKTENNMVMSWLINSMNNDIGEIFLLYETAEQIWEAAKVTYSSHDNTVELFGVESTLHELKQGEMSATQYYNTLTKYWQQLDLFEKHHWKCAEDGIRYKKIIEKKRVFKFLIGLNQNLDGVRGRILGTKPLPLLREAFSEVCREESQKKVVLEATVKSENTATDGSALAARGGQTQFNDNRFRKGNRPWCDHCKKPGHKKEGCWVLHGKPADWKPNRFTNRESRGNTVTQEQQGTADDLPFSKEQMAVLQRFFTQSTQSSQNPVVGTGSLAHKGNFLTAFKVGKEKNQSWIVDSGASDHMTGDATRFHTFQKYTGNFSVRIADGSLSKVTGVGTVVISPDLCLKSVLLVPSLDCNLLSVSKITKDQNCFAFFSHTQCIFQDLVSGKTIGNARMREGLYILQEDNSARKGSQPREYVSFKSQVTESVTLNKNNAIMLWHFRLGHPNFMYLEKLFPNLFINKNASQFQCEVCHLSKHTRSSYPTQSYKISSPLSLVHSDVWGPSRVDNFTGAKWFVSFVDDHTRITWVFLMKEKSEVFQVFKNFNSMIKTQFQTRICVLRTDNGKEYFNSNMFAYLLGEGIVHQSSCVDTPQQNGVSERKNRHLLEVARSLMIAMNVPKNFWGEAVLTAAYLINRLPSRVLNFQTPCQVFSMKFPNNRLLSHIPQKVFGCTVYVHNHSSTRSKLDPKAIKCMFIGYSPTQKGYKCYSTSTRKLYVSMDVAFMEDQPYFHKTQIQGGNKNQEFQFWDSISAAQITPSDQTGLPILPTPQPDLPTLETETAPSQNSHSPGQNSPGGHSPNLSHHSPVLSLTPLDHESDSQKQSELIIYSRKKCSQEDVQPHTQLQQVQEEEPRLQVLNQEEEEADTGPDHEEVIENTEGEFPIAIRKGYRECRNRPRYPMNNFISYDKLSPGYRAFAMNLSKIQVPNNIQEALGSPRWKEAVMAEVHALEKNKTWQIVDLPQGKKPVGCRWVFTVKHKSDGSVERFKARLVAKGYSQSYGVDYQETFAPVAKLNTIRVLLSLAANLDWNLHQLDIKNAFLNGDLEEEVYMAIPPGLETKNNANKVCKLQKSLYGLKQSPRAWFGRFTRAVKQNGYRQCQSDHTLFVKHSNGGRMTALIVYVDDIILTGNCEEEIRTLKKYLATEFETKDLGDLRYFLGMEVARSRKGISVSQRKYTLDLLKETKMLDSRPAETPMEYTMTLGMAEKSTPVDKGRYQRLVGKLIYLSHTRPDISYLVSVVSRFMNDPREEHMQAVYRILRYLKMTPGKGLLFEKHSDRDLKIYTDADWASSMVDRRSTSGYCSYVWGNLVTWRSKKQAVVSKSSAESEFRSMATGICEGIWLKRVMAELGMDDQGSVKIMCDNQAAISMAKDPVFHDKTKHVEIDRHFIKEKLEGGIIKLIYTPTSSQTADILTKPLPRSSFENLTLKLGMVNIYDPA
ncbi:hypothetical protein ACOSQ4_013190 [Xanthoceras sorbifolium]